MNWIKNRLKERTTLDGVLMIAAGAALFIAPVNLIAMGMIAYGVYTTFMEG
jgi:hypothetical protein